MNTPTGKKRKGKKKVHIVEKKYLFSREKKIEPLIFEHNGSSFMYFLKASKAHWCQRY